MFVVMAGGTWRHLPPVFMGRRMEAGTVLWFVWSSFVYSLVTRSKIAVSAPSW
ncbi:hypothetical protein ACIBTP_34115 [Streptomyces avidinii]|uniref:hypothetical protein n=1 Tax=Streptomyces avidinii TaxID=1895 RepID=UPI0037925D71